MGKVFTRLLNEIARFQFTLLVVTKGIKKENTENGEITSNFGIFLLRR